MKGKVVLVTGGAGGIGSAIVKAFAAQNCSVAVNYFKNRKNAEALKSELIAGGCNAEVFQADISNCKQAKKLCEQVIKRFGRIDILINNAGVSRSKLFTQISETELDEIMGVNFNGAFFVTQETVKDMLKRKNGRIINISSIWGKSGGAMETHYSASKAALDGLTKALAKELGPSGITVNSIACGLIDTGMNKDLSESDKKDFCDILPIARIGTPQEVADFAVFLASEKCNYITGQVVSLDGGYLI